MGRTPDRSPGPSLEEETRYEGQTTDPSEEGAVRYNEATGQFAMKDSIGVFNPRGVGADDKRVKVSTTDTTPGFLNEKVVAAEGVKAAVLNPVMDEDLQISADIPGLTAETVTDQGADYAMIWDASAGAHRKVLLQYIDDKRVKVSSNDTTPDFLEDKLVDGDGLTFTVLTEGGDEKLEIKLGGLGADSLRILAPAEPAEASQGSWKTVGSMFWHNSEFQGQDIYVWRGYAAIPGATLHVRVIRFSDGATVGTVQNYSTGGSITYDFSTGLPSADDALLLQTSKSGGGANPVIQAGFFEIGDPP